MADMKTRLQVFSDLMSTVWKIHFGQYNSEGRLLQSTCADIQVTDSLFDSTGSKQRVIEACKQSRKASMVTDSIGFVWIAVPYFSEDVFCKFFVIGPVFSTEFSENSLSKIVSSMGTPTESRASMLAYLMEIPVIQHTAFTQFGVMLQFYVSREIITSSDMFIVRAESVKPSPSKMAARIELESEAPGSYIYEHKIMKAIETGNIDFKKPQHPPKIGKLSNNNDPLRQAKNEIIVLVSITGRAALRGGLPEEAAYGLMAQYIQMVESERSIHQVYAHGVECYNDFLRRMYKLRISQGRSREIQRCIAYIEAHLCEKIDYNDMARACGYSRKYLSAKFKTEMGINMVDYINAQKVDQAKIRLHNTNDSIADIAALLNFSSNSYFGAMFSRIVGVSPSEYRNGIQLPSF